MMITIIPTPGIKPLNPHIGISLDPGTRNVGCACLKFNGPINFRTICVDTNYEIVQMGQIDLLVNSNGVEGDGSLSHIDEMIEYHFGRYSTSPLILALNKFKKSSQTYDYSFYSENQKGIGQNDRETNPYLADQLMDPHYVGGGISALMRDGHGIKTTYHPGKTSKWGNSSCPVISIQKTMTKYEKKTAQARNKIIRKNFFVYYVMNLLGRQKNTVLLTQLNQMSMDDSAHLCDAVTQGMRGMFLHLWSMLERQVGNQAMPQNFLPDDISKEVCAKLTTVYLARVSTYEPKAKKTKPKRRPTVRRTGVPLGQKKLGPCVNGGVVKGRRGGKKV